LLSLVDLLNDPSLFILCKKFFRVLFEEHFFHRRGRGERRGIDSENEIPATINTI
jgi:hypothetical protein